MTNRQGIDHVTLTVSDINQTKDFYEQLFQTKLEKDNENSFSLLAVDIPVWFVQWKNRHPNDKFDETRIGLDHIAFSLDTVKELEKFVARLKDMGVKTEGLQKFAGKFPYVAFRDPDNIQTEFFISKDL